MCFEPKRKQKEAANQVSQLPENFGVTSGRVQGSPVPAVIADPPYEVDQFPTAAEIGPAQAGGQTEATTPYDRYFTTPGKAVKLQRNVEHSIGHVLQVLRDREEQLGPRQYKAYKSAIKVGVDSILADLADNGIEPEDQVVIANFLLRATTTRLCEANVLGGASDLLKAILLSDEGLAAIEAIGTEDEGFEALVGDAAAFGHNRG